MQRATTRRAILAGIAGGGVTLIEESLSLSPGAARDTNGSIPKPPAAARRHLGRDQASAAESLILGAFHPNMPGDPSSLADFAARYGRVPGLVMWFQAWGDANFKDLDTSLLDRVSGANATPVVTWEPWAPGQGANQSDFTLAKIHNGAYDDYIDQWAKGLKNWGGAVLLRFAHEMNGNWYPWAVADNTNDNTAEDYVAAWQHVHNRFQNAKAGNVRWVWAPNVKYAGSAPLADLYPGDDYVDLIGMDGYNWGSSRRSSKWRSLANVFGPTYDELTAAHPNKPIIIAETGCPGQRPDKAEWIRKGFLSAVPNQFPLLQAVTYFDAKTDRDWRASTSRDVRKAFSAVVTSDRYRGVL
ncbi:MAG TPA: glycosyl hydrolase [Thermomicrobiales bacterium]|nr:glycosyl hydrolase [Thermomicrobiales bacterium]